MNATVQASGPSGLRRRRSLPRARAERSGSPLELTSLLAILAISAVMNVYDLSQNGYANGFYSAGVKSMLRSLHNFVFVSSDPNGLISIDKPPLSMWLQVASAKVFGFGPMSLLLPEAIAGVLSVLVLYLALSRPIGRPGALMAALTLAIFPAFVAISRDNNPDALLILLMSLSCWAALAAIRGGRLRTLLGCAVLIGLAFNTKTLAAYLVVPGIALAYALCAPGTLLRRLGKLLAAGVVLAAISLAWLLFVDATPASHRPWVGSTKDNSEISLAFEYNGFGRLEGQAGGPEEIKEDENLPGAFVPLRTKATPSEEFAPERPKPPTVLPDGRASKAVPFAREPGPLRLFEGVLGVQAGWFVPLALLGMLALALLVWRTAARARPASRPGAPRGPASAHPGDGAATAHSGDGAPPARGVEDGEGVRRDPRLAVLLVFGGWFLVEALFLTVAKGIVHPYYSSELAPGAAAMVGAGLWSLALLIRRDRRWWALLLAAVALTAIAQVTIFDENNYMQWFGPVLIAAAVLGALSALLLRGRAPTLWATLGVLCIAPAVYAAATWSAPVQGTFPVAGPRGMAGFGGVDINPTDRVGLERALAYLARQHIHTRYSILTVSSVASSPLILMGSDAASLAGYSGVDPAVSAQRLAALVKDGQARYVLLGGPYANRGGNAATKAVLKTCRIVPASAWGNPRTSAFSLVLMDCAGRSRALAAA